MWGWGEGCWQNTLARLIPGTEEAEMGGPRSSQANRKQISEPHVKRDPVSKTRWRAAEADTYMDLGPCTYVYTPTYMSAYMYRKGAAGGGRKGRDKQRKQRRTGGRDRTKKGKGKEMASREDSVNQD